MQEKRRGFTTEERESIKKLLRYAVAIFGAVALTLVIIALVSSLLVSAT
jgi:hypothetical protein